MDLLYVVNTGSQSLVWGPSSNLTQNLGLGFDCHRLAVMPGNRFLYVTGNKTFSSRDVHAWLAVVDTCDNSVVSQLDMGPGFAGQCAVPVAPGGPNAFVAISQAVGDIDTGNADGGGNRIAQINVLSPHSPTLAASHFVGGRPYGTLNLVRSDALDRVYTCHRQDGTIYQLDLNATPQVTLLHSPSGQPMALGISGDGYRLFVGRRDQGDLIEIGLAPFNPLPSVHLTRASTASSMYIVVAPGDRVLITAQRPSGSNFPSDGTVNIYERPQGGAAQVTPVDLLGYSLGQPAVSPDGVTAYIPEGSRNDVVAVDLATKTLLRGYNTAGSIPVDVLALDHDASIALNVTPDRLAVACDTPTRITVSARDACGSEISGFSVAAFATGPIGITPLNPQPIPANFIVTCHNGGPATVVFSSTTPPFPSVNLPVQCQCLIPHCFNFQTLPNGLVPPGTTITVGGVAIAVSTVATSPPGSPMILSPRPGWLQLHRGSVRFQVQSPHSVDNLMVHIRRSDRQSPADTVTVALESGQTATFQSPGGFVQGTWQIFCPLTRIKEWTVKGGPESYILEICFYASF